MKLRVLLLLIIFSSCEESSYIPVPNVSNKPVLNLLMNKDSVMLARLTLSTPLAGYFQMDEIKNGVVNLYENGAFIETLTPVTLNYRTYYQSNTLARAGATYRVTAAAPGYPEVSGSDHIPDTVRPGEMKMITMPTDNLNTQATVSVQIHDDPAVQNYYRIRFFQVIEWRDNNGNIRRDRSLQYFDTEDAGLPIFSDDTESDFYTTDALFNGRSPRFTFRMNLSYMDKKLVAEITALTFDSYNYLNSAYMAARKNDDGFSEKVIVYNNILNGLGIIGGQAKRDYEIVR